MESDYPDPSALLAYAREPMVFMDIHEMDREMEEDGSLVYTQQDDRPDDPSFPGTPSVEFRFQAAYVNLEVGPDERTRADGVDIDVDHVEVFDKALVLESGSDFLVAVAFIQHGEEPVMAKAYWLLDEVRTKTAAIDRGE
jgi:hypothetical protein